MIVAHKRLKRMKALNRMRSATAPVIRATVMTANAHWYIANAMCGMVAVPFGSGPTPLKNAKSNPPMSEPMSVPNEIV
jgi:hypothetical protein